MGDVGNVASAGKSRVAVWRGVLGFERVHTLAPRSKIPALRGTDGCWRPVDVQGAAGATEARRRAYEAAEAASVAEGGVRPGVGVLARWCPALDVDVDDPAIGLAVEAVLAHRAPGKPLFRRVGRPPRFLVPFRLRPGAKPFAKLAMVAGPGQRVEILADGQQWVAEGIHPDTGLPYVWTRDKALFGGGAGITAAQWAEDIGLSASGLPTMTVGSALSVMTEIMGLLRAQGHPARWSSGKPHETVSGADLNTNALSRSKAGPPELMVSALDAIPNPPELDRDAWVEVAHAVKGAFGDAHEAEGFEAFDAWSQQHETYDAGATLVLWETMAPRYAGAVQLTRLAAAQGWDRYGEWVAFEWREVVDRVVDRVERRASRAGGRP